MLLHRGVAEFWSRGPLLCRGAALEKNIRKNAGGGDDKYGHSGQIEKVPAGNCHREKVPMRHFSPT